LEKAPAPAPFFPTYHSNAKKNRLQIPLGSRNLDFQFLFMIAIKHWGILGFRKQIKWRLWRQYRIWLKKLKFEWFGGVSVSFASLTSYLVSSRFLKLFWSC
jgi:hypothetical protein